MSPGRAAVCSLAFAPVLAAVLGACSGEDAAAPVDAPTPEAAAPTPAPTTPPPAHVDAAAPHDAAPPPAPLDVPASLVKALGDKTYVEGNCQSVTHPGWPNAAQKCTYQNGLVVTIANPT